MTSDRVGSRVRSHAPGRVNLIGEHTDYTGGLVLPIAIQRGTTIEAELVDGFVHLRSDRRRDTARFQLPVTRIATMRPTWGRFVAGVTAELDDGVGLRGRVGSDLTIGGGLASSSSLTVAATLALGATGSPLDVALASWSAEVRATGVASGLMDQIVIAGAVADHALLIDCTTNETTAIPVPEAAQIVVVDSGEHRHVATSEYRRRTEQCAAAAELVGPLRDATLDVVESIEEPTVRRRARHVVTENERVRAFVDAFRSDDLREAGRILTEGHRSLRDDFEVSTPTLDRLVEELAATPGVLGARVTGAGFGGCVVALCEPEVDLGRGLVARASGAARVEVA
jgi:galactokinase